jgi:hypothetical protein
MKLTIASLALLLALSAGLKPLPASAQTPSSARDSAPIDLTGYWVSYVTENWRYRMVTPAKGEYRRIPASPAALPLINAGIQRQTRRRACSAGPMVPPPS